MAFQQKRFTIYDMMEARGTFTRNPANVGSVSEMGDPLYKGPVKYPKMLYHPEGKEEVVSKGDVMVTPLGAQKVNVHSRIVHKIVNNEEEERALLEQGWHTHPAKAIAASGKEAPPISTAELIGQKDEEIKRLEQQLAEMKANLAPAPTKSTGKSAS